jgi:hypothetical protein
MVDWFRPHFAEGNEIVNLFYAITDCCGQAQVNEDRSHGSSGVIATAATEASSGNALPQILTNLGARTPAGKAKLHVHK